MCRTYGYARISQKEQSIERQIRNVKAVIVRLIAAGIRSNAVSNDFIVESIEKNGP